jgi:hypothetical protein
VRIGLPLAIALAGIIVIVAGSGTAATGLGVVWIGVAAIAVLANVLARLTLSSQDDRLWEQPRQTPIQAHGSLAQQLAGAAPPLSGTGGQHPGWRVDAFCAAEVNQRLSGRRLARRTERALGVR